MTARSLAVAALILVALVIVATQLGGNGAGRAAVADTDRDPNAQEAGPGDFELDPPRGFQEAPAASGVEQPAPPSSSTAPETENPYASPPVGRNLAHVESLRAGSGPDSALRIVMNSTADILHAEGAGTRLEEGSTFAPGEIDGPNRRAIVRHAWDGAWLYVAERERFPLLFELIEAFHSGGKLTEEQCAAVRLMAQQADAAYQQMNPSSPRSAPSSDILEDAKK